MTSPRIPMEQMVALHGFFAEAAAVSESGLSELCGSDCEIEVLEVRCTTLAEFGERGLLLSDDLVAGVRGRLDGPLPGSLNLVVEPEEALLWSRLGSDRDPLETFVERATEVLAGLAAGLTELESGPASFRDPELVEASELAMLIGTHAPSDTLVLSTRMGIDAREETIHAHMHWLIEPKYLAPLLSALSAAVH